MQFIACETTNMRILTGLKATAHPTHEGQVTVASSSVALFLVSRFNLQEQSRRRNLLVLGLRGPHQQILFFSFCAVLLSLVRCSRKSRDCP